MLLCCLFLQAHSLEFASEFVFWAFNTISAIEIMLKISDFSINGDKFNIIFLMLNFIAL